MEEKVFKSRMDFWQKAIRYLYKDLQEFHKWSDDKVWLELKNEIIKNYLDLCIKKEAQKVLQAKYNKCLKKNNATFCQLTTKLDP